MTTTALPRVTFRVPEVAEMTGLSVTAVYDLVRSGQLPAARMSDKKGAAVLVRLSDLEAFIADRTEGNALPAPAAHTARQRRLRSTA